jgi:plastocyanin
MIAPSRSAFPVKIKFCRILLVLLFACCGCSKSGTASKLVAYPEGPTATVDAATSGSISGTVKLDGKPPVLRPINMSAEPTCEKAHPTPVPSPEVVLGPGGALANVVVYVKGAALDKYKFSTPTQPVELDQRGCMYQPHVVALRVGQELQVRNDDQTTHNVHALPQINPEWNKSQPPGAGPIDQTFSLPETAIPIRCNVHPWMNAYVFVFKTPYYAVTGKSGEFSIGNLPPGTYTIEAWQEKYGVEDQTVTIGPKESKDVPFTFKTASAPAE